MPNLLNTGVKELREFNAPGTLAIQPTMEDNEDILMTTKEVQMRPNKNGNRQREFRFQSNNSYNPATTPEATTPVPLEKSFISKPEPGDEGYDTVKGECAEKSIYLHPRVGFQGRDSYDCAETESIFSEQTENEVRPLTFTQATNVLNNKELDFSKLNTYLQRGNGVKSAESIFDGDETLVEQDDPHLRYERACEAELNEVTFMLKRMQMEKQNLNCIIGNTSHYQSQLIRKLQMLQQNRKNGYRRSPFGAPYALPGVHSIDVANHYPVNLSPSCPFAGRSRSRYENADYQNYPYAQPHPPIGCYQYLSGSMDSIDDVSRNSSWTPDDNEQPNGQIQSMLNHHYMHNPHVMQRFGTDGSCSPFIPGNEKPMTPRVKVGKHSNTRYSMYDTTQMGSPLVSATHYSEGYPEHLTQKQSIRSLENMKASQHFEAKNIYLHPNKPLPQTTFVTQYLKPPSDSFNKGTSGQSRHSIHISQTEDPSMGHFSHISRADIRRRISGSERPRPYSQDRFSSEQNIQGVRRRKDVSQIQKRRTSQIKKSILQEEIDEANNCSEHDRPDQSKHTSERNLNAKELDYENAHLGVVPNESRAVGNQEVDDVLQDISRNHCLTTTNIVRHDPELVPIEVTSPMDSLQEDTFNRENSYETINVQQAVRHLCLGPLNGFKLEVRQNSSECGNVFESSPITTPPSWIGVCYGDCNVAVYDLKSLSCIVRCEDHMRYSQSPVVAMLPFVSQDISIKSESECFSKISPGLLCVVQEDGNMTLYNLENERVSGRISINEKIAFAFMLPQTKVIPKSLIQLVLSVTASGNVICFQWNLVRYLKELENKRLPVWEAETHDMGVNVFDQLSGNGSEVPYVCCVAPQQQPKSNSGTGSCSPRSPMTPGKELATGNFSLVAASILSSDDKSGAKVRLCRWVQNSSMLKLSQCVDKKLSCESGSKLVGITYAEIGGAASICLCMTADIFWFSFRSADLVTSIKLPLCAQPTNLIPSIWPHKCLGSSPKSKPNERVWAAVGGRNVLELSAFNSQRRHDSTGRGCLTLLYVYPSDSTITALTSVKYEDEVVIAGTDEGQIYFIPVQNTCYVCQIPNCILGFCLKEDLVFHLVRDHYYTDCPTTSGESAICNWPNCDSVIKQSNERIDLTNVKKHAMQHACEQ